MLIVTINEVPGKKIEALGVVRGSTVQSRNLGHDIMAGFRTLVGGEVTAPVSVLPSRKPAQRDLEPFLHHVLAQIFKFQGAQVLIFQHILSPPLAVRSDSHCLTAQLYHKNTGWYRAEQKLPMAPEERLI